MTATAYTLQTLASLLPFETTWGADTRSGWIATDTGKVTFDLPGDWHGTPAVGYIDDIPVLYTGVRPSYLFCDGQCGFDLLGAIFWLLARQEESDAPRDVWGQFAAPYSQLYQMGLLHRPIINLWAQALASEFQRQGSQKVHALWPNGHPFAVALTHDVDILRAYVPRHQARYVAKLLHMKSSFKKLLLGGWDMGTSLIRPVRQMHFFEDWLALEDEFGARSSFYFSPQMPYTRPPDNLYSLDEPIHFEGQRQPLNVVISELAKRGWEVGLHATFHSFLDSERLRLERERVAQAAQAEIQGARQHWLHLNPTRTWSAQAAAGLRYDTTLGYNEAPGHRAGIAFPFRAYAVETGQMLDFWVLPMSIMDGALLSANGLALPETIAIDYGCRIIDEIANTGGLCVLNWHPEHRALPAWWSTYRALLRYAAEHSAWLTTARAVIEHWAARVQQSI